MTKIPVLFKLMNERNINQTKLAKDTNISTGNISDWKSGRSMPSSKKLDILAKYFNVSTDYLLGNENNIMESYPNISEEDINMFNSLELKDREAVRTLMKSLLNK